MDDGVLRIADSRKAAVEWLRHLHGVPKDEARMSGLDAAMELLGGVAERELRSGDALFHAVAVAALVESLLARGADADLNEADATCSGWLTPSRRTVALRWGKFGWCGRRHFWPAPAETRPPTATIAIATAPWPELGFEGHMKWAEAMT